MTGPLPQGPGYVCIDASPLIIYSDAGHLVWLSTWFGGGLAFTADVITKVELVTNLKKFPKNQDIVDQPWLQSVPVEDDEDVKFVTQLRRIWGSEPKRDFGEAEVLALSRSNGWTAIIDDGRGRDAAARFGVPCVTSTTMLVAATASTYESCETAWAIHKDLMTGFDRPILPPVDDYFPALEKSVKAFKTIGEAMEGTVWPRILADPRADKLVARAVSQRRGELGAAQA